jgi:hypothetical protein
MQKANAAIGGTCLFPPLSYLVTKANRKSKPKKIQKPKRKAKRKNESARTEQ